jgi:signal transduction histidine kinase
MEFMLKHLKGETNASLKTLENILQWARLQMNDNSLLVAEIDEDGIIIEIIQNFESNTEAKEIFIKYVNKSNSVLWADENQFRSIANNIIANAIKYSPLRGEIIVSFVEERDNFVFSVCDQGSGIHASVIKNLETQQELMSSYGTEGEKGTGIGLRIVKDFVHLHNGKIEFTANQPSGTIVTIYLPKLIKHEMVSDSD